MRLACLVCLFLAASGAEPLPDGSPSTVELQRMTRNRQQHRRTMDGRMCAAAFVQNRQAYTGCTAALVSNVLTACCSCAVLSLWTLIFADFCVRLAVRA